MSDQSQVITDVHPKVGLCPLPDGYWWEVKFIMRLDSCHMTLHRGHWWNPVTEVGDTAVVLDVSDKTTDDITRQLIDRSYSVWQDYFRKVGSWQQDWINTAKNVEDELRRRSTVRIKFKVERQR